jgi:hypothetical protein
MKSYTDKNQDKSTRSADSCSKPQQSDGATFQLVDNRDATIAQYKMAEAINSSPKQVTQRKQLHSLFGNAVQLQSMHEDGLQMKSDSEPLQQIGQDEEELLQGQFETAQRQGGLEDEELLQGKFQAAQRQENLEDDELVQGKFAASPIQRQQDHTTNNTGLPDNLKAGIENLSGYSMDDVSVHYNSPKPEQIQAHAYAQGADIHLASGQEKHLPHEAWHVVQQRQGRVRPTIQMSGVQVNDDEGLEREADVMGRRALQKTGVMFDARSDLTPRAPLSSTDIMNQYTQLHAQVHYFGNPIQLHSGVVQRGNDPIDESAGKPFKYGLIKGTYVPASNTADMHVENKTEETAFSVKDVYFAFSFVYNNMVKQKKISGIEGRLTWNPQGAAVIKMVAELLGESLGNPELLKAARELKKLRKQGEEEDVVRDANVISADIIPEHLQYLAAARGAEGVEMKAVIPGNNTEENFDSDMLKDSTEGRSRVHDYREALESKIPVSLRITINQTQLKMLLETMKKNS